MTEQEQRRRAERALAESRALRQALHLRTLPSEGPGFFGFWFLIGYLLFLLYMIAYCTTDSGIGGFILSFMLAALSWNPVYSLVINASMSEEVFSGDRRIKVRSPAHERQEKILHEVAARILNNNVEPLDKLMQNLEDPAYVQHLLEAQSKTEKSSAA